MFNIQRPATWLFNAFGIISGGAPQRMWEEVNPMVDVAQGGLGLEVVRTFGNFNNVGVPFVQPQSAEDAESGKYAWLFRCSGDSLDSAATYFEATYVNLNGAGEVRLVDLNVPAGASFSWRSLNGGMDYGYIPPGCRLILVLGAPTTVHTVINYELVRIVAGTKPW